MNTQTFAHTQALTAITDDELTAVNGGVGPGFIDLARFAKNGPIDPNPSLQNLRGSTHFG
jgi:hypothetical protein